MTTDVTPWPPSVPPPGYAPPHEPREHRPAFHSPHTSRSIVLLGGLSAAAQIIDDYRALFAAVCELWPETLRLVERHRAGVRDDALADAREAVARAEAGEETALLRAVIAERVAERAADRAVVAEARVEAARAVLVRLEALAARGGSAEGREAVRGMRGALW